MFDSYQLVPADDSVSVAWAPDSATALSAPMSPGHRPHPSGLLRSDDCRYVFPRRRLALSIADVFYVEIPSKKKTFGAKYSGHELLIPFEGAVTVGFNKGEMRSSLISRSDCQFAHYLANEEHVIENPEDERTLENAMRIGIDRISPIARLAK